MLNLAITLKRRSEAMEKKTLSMFYEQSNKEQRCCAIVKAVEDSMCFLSALKSIEFELSSDEYAAVMIYHDTLTCLLNTALREYVGEHREELQKVIDREVHGR